MGASDVVNAAKTAWDVIEDGAISPDVATSTCSAMPHVDDLTSISAPVGTNHMSRQILYFRDTSDGLEETVRVNWTLNWEYGSKYKGGGAFIPNCWITVEHAHAVWGWKIDLTMTVHNPTNAGTDTAPIARLPISLNKHLRTKWGVEDEVEPFDWVIYGDGRIETNGH
jgi:hypothetical protein